MAERTRAGEIQQGDGRRSRYSGVRVVSLVPPVYDPDKDVYQEGPPKLELAVDLSSETTEVDARLYEYNPLKNGFITQRYSSKKRFIERLVQVDARYRNLRESGFEYGDWFTTGTDWASAASTPQLGGWVNSEYLPMMVGPFSRQLYMFDYLDMHRKAFEAVNHNPLGRQIVNIKSTFVVGKGVTATCKDQKAQQVWDRFVTFNDLWKRMRTWSDELCMYGELMLRTTPDPLSRTLKVRSVDPATVWEIVTEPDDIERVYYYHQQYPTQYQIYTKPGVPMTRYIIRQIPGPEILHTKVNVTSGEKRGRSDLFSILGWLKRLKDYYTAQVVRAQMQASHVWDDTVSGSPQDVVSHSEWLKANPPMPGEVFVHNDAVTRQMISAQARGVDLSAEGEMLMNLVGVGAGIPKEYLGISVAGARATALVATEPAAKAFEDRQYTLEWMLHQLARRVFAYAGLSPYTDIEFTFPSIATEDRTTKLKDLALAESMAWISRKTAATMATKELLITTYSFEGEMNELAEELGGEDPRNLIGAAFGLVKKVPQEVPFGVPGRFPGNGQGEPTVGQELATKVRNENNPLTPTGAKTMSDDLRRKEADEGKAEAPVAGATMATTTKIDALREAKPTNFRPGYRSKYGQDVEKVIADAQESLRNLFKGARATLGDEKDLLTRSNLIEFERTLEVGVQERLLGYASLAYAIGVQKGIEQSGKDRATEERHAALLGTWHTIVQERMTRVVAAIDEWWEEAQQKEDEDDKLVLAFVQRWEPAITTLGLGLWTVYQLGFREAISGGVRTEGEPSMVNYIAVGDENTCDPCMDAAAGSPYPVDEVPLPGEICLGRERCRCELEYLS